LPLSPDNISQNGELQTGVDSYTPHAPSPEQNTQNETRGIFSPAHPHDESAHWLRRVGLDISSSNFPRFGQAVAPWPHGAGRLRAGRVPFFCPPRRYLGTDANPNTGRSLMESAATPEARVATNTAPPPPRPRHAHRSLSSIPMGGPHTHPLVTRHHKNPGILWNAQ